MDKKDHEEMMAALAEVERRINSSESFARWIFQEVGLLDNNGRKLDGELWVYTPGEKI